jgi:tetratricopeptide (TPR) repeat protein
VIHRASPTFLAFAALALACATAAPRAPAAAAAPAARREPAALVADGEAALGRNEFARAGELLAEAAKLAPADPRPVALRSFAVFQQARFDEALALARASLGLGETYEARLVEGRVSAIRRDLGDAVRAYERCTVLRPAAAEGWSALTAARLALGDADGAAEAWVEVAKLEEHARGEDRLWTDILRLPPDPAQVQEALDRCARGTAALVSGHAGEAVHEFRAVVGSIPTYAHCWSELGRASAKINPADAERAFRKAHETYRPDQAPLRADTEALLARLLLDGNGDATEALALAKAAAEIRKGRPDVIATVARACEKTRDASCADLARSAGAKVEASATEPPKPVPGAAQR